MAQNPELIVDDGGDGGDGGVGCYLTGTRLASPQGAVCVEDVAVGSMVLTASGEPRAVQWVGHRTINCRLMPDPAEVWPIQIKAGAFAADQPSRDLWVSPGHSIFVSGVLIQAENLVNGATVVQVPQESVQYWHVELDQHDVLVAEGLAAESYLDTGNRTDFSNGGAFVEAHPDFRSKHWAETCAPLVFEGEILESVRASLLARAAQLGYETTSDAGAHIIADGRRIEPVLIRDDCFAFGLPANCSAIELRSNSFVPCHVLPSSDDRRRLGLCIRRLQIDGTDIPLNGESFPADGWHLCESDSSAAVWRWSKERVPLAANTRLILIETRNPGIYWRQQTSTVSELNTRSA